jgi:hypothetical protein
MRKENTCPCETCARWTIYLPVFGFESPICLPLQLGLLFIAAEHIPSRIVIMERKHIWFSDIPEGETETRK